MTIILAHQLLMAGATCPDYRTVTLRLTGVVYSPPSGNACDVSLLSCPYTPPTV